MRRSDEEKRGRGEIGWKWAEGVVGPDSEHLALYYGDGRDSPDLWRKVAMVGKPQGYLFPVTWLVGPGDPEEEIMMDVARNDLDFYLLEAGGPDPWGYAVHRCGTYANWYSVVHWVYVTGKKGRQ